VLILKCYHNVPIFSIGESRDSQQCCVQSNCSWCKGIWWSVVLWNKEFMKADDLWYCLVWLSTCAKYKMIYSNELDGLVLRKTVELCTKSYTWKRYGVTAMIIINSLCWFRISPSQWSALNIIGFSHYQFVRSLSPESGRLSTNVSSSSIVAHAYIAMLGLLTCNLHQYTEWLNKEIWKKWHENYMNKSLFVMSSKLYDKK